MLKDKRFDLQLFGQEGEKTEDPTPKHRREARQKGQVARSTELTSSLLLIVTFTTLYLMFPALLGRFMEFTETFWREIPHIEYTISEVHQLFITFMLEGMRFVGPIMIAAVIVGIVANGLQIGLLFTGQPLIPKLEKIDPFQGFKKIFSKRSMVELVKSIIKMVIIGFIAYMLFLDQIDEMPTLFAMPVMQIASLVGNLTWTMIFQFGLALLGLSLLDFIYQVWEHEQNLKMTKQQVKDEYKQTEGDPQVRSKIKEKQREISNKRMMSEVPEADVVVTNPIHLAVAIKYETGYTAPMVVAKGQGLVANRIKEIAEEHEVVVVENRELARSLYMSVEIGDLIPEELYQAVAEVLAFVYRLKRSK